MTKRRGLGKGLEALIPADAAVAAGQWGLAEPTAGPGVRQVSLDQIDPNPHQPRAPADDADLASLAASISEHGLIQPVIVTQVGSRFQLIAGERRWRAARLAGLDNLVVLVKEATPLQMLELALVENVQRADLNVLEEAAAYRHLMDDFGLTQEQIAGRVGKSRPAISNMVRLLALPREVKSALLESRISEGHGRALLKLATAEAQIAALAVIEKRTLTVRQAEELVGRLLGETPPVNRRPIPDEIRDIAERLRQRLGTRVDVRHGKRGGRIVIHYYSDEELEALVEQIASVE